jgi:hypothetical protein
METLEFDRYIQGKELKIDDVKGMLLEKAISDALNEMGIQHRHNPFNNTYPCYQGKSPDIVIERLNILVECKNICKKEADNLSIAWLNKNIIDRPHNKGYRRKFVLFSYKPKPSKVHYLHKHGWRAYGLETQILTPKEMQKATGKLKQKLYWLKKEYYGDKLSKPKQQTKLKTNYFKEIVY